MRSSQPSSTDVPAHDFGRSLPRASMAVAETQGWHSTTQLHSEFFLYCISNKEPRVLQHVHRHDGSAGYHASWPCLTGSPRYLVLLFLSSCRQIGTFLNRPCPLARENHYYVCSKVWLSGCAHQFYIKGGLGILNKQSVGPLLLPFCTVLISRPPYIYRTMPVGLIYSGLGLISP